MENEKTNEIIVMVWDSLTDEQKAKAKACKTADEIVKFASEEGIELPDEALDAVAGGALMVNDRTCKVDVIDDKTGLTLESFGTKKEAENYAKAHGIKTRYIDWDEVQRIQNQYAQSLTNSSAKIC